MSVGLGANPSFLAVSPQVTLVINPVVGCRYFPLGQYQIILLGNIGTQV